MAEMRASGFPSLDEGIRDSLPASIDPVVITVHFEKQAGRGEQSGQAPHRHERRRPRGLRRDGGFDEREGLGLQPGLFATRQPSQGAAQQDG
jgi:hypothetical protein